MAAHSAFNIFRRFSNIRTRLLLLAQDKIVNLEEQLMRIDQAEKSPLFLASSREDRNSERDLVISQLYTRLEEYGKTINSVLTRACVSDTPILDKLMERSQRHSLTKARILNMYRVSNAGSGATLALPETKPSFWKAEKTCWPWFRWKMGQ
jgi:hypothetical protein